MKSKRGGSSYTAFSQKCYFKLIYNSPIISLHVTERTPASLNWIKSFLKQQQTKLLTVIDLSRTYHVWCATGYTLPPDRVGSRRDWIALDIPALHFQSDGQSNILEAGDWRQLGIYNETKPCKNVRYCSVNQIKTEPAIFKKY
jgi:hypothetical protein